MSRQSVARWYQAWAARGSAALKRRPHTGRRPQLDAEAWAQLAAVLARGALAAGFDTERWTLRRVAAVAARDLGVRHHVRSYGPILRAHQWTPQVPAVQAKERDDTLVRAWLTRDWPALTKDLGARGARLPSWTRRVTRFGPGSAPRGHPPVLRRVSRRREVSSIVVITAPLDGQPARLYARHFEGTIDSARVIASLPYVRRKIGRPLLLVWDRLNAHVSRRTQAWLAAHATDYAATFLPGYSPELNPEEQCNRHVKHALLNALPTNVAALRAQVQREFRRLGRQPDVLAGFFRHAGLRVT